MYIIIKAFLDDLIDFCYKGTVEPDMLAKYHKFYIKLTDKELKSKLGHYIFSKKLYTYLMLKVVTTFPV